MVLLANLARKLPRNRIDETFIKSKIHHNRDSKSQMYQDVSKGLSLYETLRGDPLPDTMVTLLKEFYSVDYTVFSNTF